MKTLARTFALAAAATTFAAGAQASLMEPGLSPMLPEMQFQPEIILAQARPPSEFSGNWYVSPQGCAYSRTQAPGHSAVWILIQNPHHLGLPHSSADCPNTL